MTDFRQLNEVTVGNSYPIPQQVDIIDAVATAKYITCLDLTSGYYQVMMHPEHSKYTSFSGLFGHYEYTQMLLGLKNAPATFMAQIGYHQKMIKPHRARMIN